MHTLILHGWSGSSSSFMKIKKLLISQKLGTVETILYVDYESREDSVTFNDIVDGLNDQLIKRAIISPTGKKKKEVNVIIHSTGGLIIRHYIWRYYRDRLQECPIKRIVMLAPANFGSPLAHRGKSFFASLIKGRWKFGDLFEVGYKILNGLELASPYQWELAHRDLFREKPYYNAKQIQLTILVGIEGYSGALRGLVNRPGSDGTVVIAGTSIDSAKLTLDFSKPRIRSSYTPYDWTCKNPPEEFGFAVLEGVNHTSIVQEAGCAGSQTASLILEALQTNRFPAFIKKLETITKKSYAKAKKPIYQQILLHAIDDQDAPIFDFTVEFFILKASRTTGHIVSQNSMTAKEEELSDRVQDLLTEDFHTNSQNSSFRRFLIDLRKVQSLLKEAKKSLGTHITFTMRIYVPDIDKGIRYNTENLQNIVLYHSKDPAPFSFFYENTTTLVELKVDRQNTYVSISTSPSKH